MADTERPSFDLAEKTLPPSLLKALLIVFAGIPSGLGLVGGTALAGFYAGHRRSDDLDLFANSNASFEAAVTAVKTLPSFGAVLQDEFRSKTYFKAVVLFEQQNFTIDVVLDSRIFSVGEFISLPEGPLVASLKTILMMKCAALVSRCSEKDLYDLLWLFERFPEISLDHIVTLGNEVDGGVNGESLIISLGSTQLRKEACGFALNSRETPDAIHKSVVEFQRLLLRRFSEQLHKKNPAGTLYELVKAVRALKK